METQAHQTLKHSALAWLGAQGCVVAACEVRCPISRYRVDAAGYADPPALAEERRVGRVRAGPRGEELRLGRTIFIECKASRSDFLRETHERPSLLAARDRLHRELEQVRAEYVRACEPHLRISGTYLFPDMESWDYDRSESKASRVIVRELRRIDLALHQQTKFFMLAHYRLADELLLLSPPGLIDPSELPKRWGLLYADSGVDAASGPAAARLVVPPEPLAARPHRALRALRNIAVASCRPAWRSAAPPSLDAGGVLNSAEQRPPPAWPGATPAPPS